MGEGAALCMETADITLLDSDLRKIEYGIRMGRRVSSKIAQNVVFSIAVKALVLVFALLGRAELWAAIAVDVGAMLVVTLNAMTLLPRQSSSAARAHGVHKELGQAPLDDSIGADLPQIQ
jgi:Zn2+/Cd2+-exporting ATPase